MIADVIVASGRGENMNFEIDEGGGEASKDVKYPMDTDGRRQNQTPTVFS